MLSGTTTSTALVTLPSPTAVNYKTELVRHVRGLVITTLTGTVLSERAMIVPVNPFNLEEATAAEYKLRVATASGKYYFGLAKVTDTTGVAAAEAFAAVNTGINNIPVNVPVLLRAKTSSGYSWAVTSAPSGSAPVLNDAGTQFPDFTAQVPGTYVLTQSTGTTTQLTLYAGTWRGAVTGEDANGRPQPDSACTACHNDTVAPDKFTPWKNSGHAEIFKQNLNAGGHYGPSCFPCHTVGFNTNATAVNNGFDDQPNYSAFIGDASWFGTTPDATRYSRLWTTYPDLAKLTNVQCENCHGPQQDATVGPSNPAHGGVAGDPRISLSADVCGACHGEPQRHARFQQWEDSGHGNL